MKRLIKLNNTIKLLKLTNDYFNLYEITIANVKDTLDNYDIIDSLIDLVLRNEHDKINLLFDKINNKFPNCMYNGIAYRKLYLSNDIFNVPNNGKITKEILESNIRNEIRTSNLQSFSKSLSVCETFVPLLENNGPEECVIIGANLKNAIDIVELSETIKENIENDLKNEENLTRTQKNKLNFMFKQLNEMIEDFGLEEEVFGMIPDDYKILSVNDYSIDDLINEMEGK